MNISITSGAQSSSGGIDVTATVNQILDADRAPERLWQAQQDTLTQQTTAWAGINTSLSGLSDRVSALKDVLGVLNGQTAVSSQPGIVTASADNSAISGSHVVVVSGLASTSSYYTDPMAGSATLTNGKITLRVGNNTAIDIPVDDAHRTRTLSGLADYFNGHDLGVQASVIQDANGSRLALVSKTTGLPGDLSITSDVAELHFNKIGGKNAALTVDGIPISSAGNSVAGVIPGVTLKLSSASVGTEVQVSVGPDLNAVKRAISDFVNAYNSVMQAVNTQFTVNPQTNASGVLASDGTLRSLQSSLLQDAAYAMKGNNGITGLASIGVNMQNDGTLSIDDDKLSEVLDQQFSDLQNFFQSADSKNSGFASPFSSDLLWLTDPISGSIGLDLKQINTNQQFLTQQINNLEDRLTVRQRELTKQYSAIDTALRQYSILMQQLQGQLGSLPQWNQQ